MPIVKAQGVILRSIKYSESSLILDVFTLEYGLRSMIISGVRKSKSKSKIGLYQVMNFLEFVFYENEKDTLCRIKEVKTTFMYSTIYKDVVKSSIGMLMTEITRNAIKEKSSNPELFEFLKQWFIFLDTSENSIANFMIKYMLDLSRHLGFEPMPNYSETNYIFDTYEGQFISNEQTNQYCASPAVSKFIFDLIKAKHADIHLYQSNGQMRTEALDMLIQFYQLQLESFKDLKSVAILRQVLS